MKTNIVTTAFCFCFINFTLANVPQLINYQGFLMDPGTDQSVADATYSMTFSLYDAASGGSPVWAESQSVQTQNGLYDVLLGSTTPLTPTIFSGSEKFLGIQVGSDPEMIPRKRIVSVAYAITCSEVLGTSNVFPSDGNVGVGTPTPAAKFEVVGSGGTNLEIDSPLPARTFTTVRSSKYLSMESKNAYGAFITGNAYFDGSNWQRGTTTYGASQIRVLADTQDQPGRIEFRIVDSMEDERQAN